MRTLNMNATDSAAPIILPQVDDMATDLRVSGYASLFDRSDLSGDIVHRGAFSASILALGSARLPMLFGHQTQTPIGVWDRLLEDKTGLFVSGRVLPGSTLADRTIRLVREGALSGLSIGYRAKRAIRRADMPTNPPLQSGGRHLYDLDLWEVSIVAFPMLRDARITQVDDISFPSNTSPHTGVNRESFS